MILYHATSVRNLRSISRHGLLTSKAAGKSKLVWLHAAPMMSWAVHHVSQRHRWDADDVVILEVSLRPTAVTRGSRDGVYKTDVDIDTGDIVRVVRLRVVDVPVAYDIRLGGEVD